MLPRSSLSALALLALAPGALAACSSTLPPAPPHAFVAAAPASPSMQVCWVEFSTNEKSGGYGLAGRSERDTWHITYSGLLVRHPQGDLLIDAGNSLHFDEEKKTAGFFSGILLGLYPGAGDRVASAPGALKQAGEAPAGLKAIVLTHVHADHAGGVMDLPGVPVVLSIDELNDVRAVKGEGGFDVVKAQGEAIERRAQPVRFAKAPDENFDQSYDYFGDGSVVFVPLAGHTPGSMGVFVNRSRSERLFHVGDAVTTVEAVEKRRGKSFAMQVTDHEGERADALVAKLAQLHRQDPALSFVPAHDRAVWQRLFGAPGRCVGEARAR